MRFFTTFLAMTIACHCAIQIAEDTTSHTAASLAFTKAHQRLEQPWRAVPLYILNDIIENPLHVKLDPRGHSNAYMYYARIWKNGKLYNAEVLYDATTNTISHFLYRRDPLGPLKKVKNNV